MAVRGLSMIEREEYILSFDPAHNDNIKDAVSRIVKGKSLSEEEKDRIVGEQIARVGAPTVFLLGNLTHDDRTFLADMVANFEQTREGNMRMRQQGAFRMSEAVRRGLRGWENFTNETGENIPFELVPSVDDRGTPRKVVSPACMSHLTLDMIRELAIQILKINGVTTDFEKKLEEQLQLPSDQPSQDGIAETVNLTSKSQEGAA